MSVVGWANNTTYRGGAHYNSGPGGPGGPGGQQPQWNPGGRPPVGTWGQQGAGGGYQGAQSPGQWQSGGVGVGQNANMRPIRKPFPPLMQPGGVGKAGSPGQTPGGAGGGNSYSHNQLPKREITFPPDSVEATHPVMYRRKRLCRADLGPVDAWRLIMCLRSGLLSESTYALDMLNVLLYDDSSVGYFGLNQWPGLLDLLLEHFRKSLYDMFEDPFHKEEPDDKHIDLGAVVRPIDPNSKTVLLNNTTNYSFVSRKGHPVKMVERNDDIFVEDNVKDWDLRGDVNRANTLAEIPTDPWHTTADHILPTFQAEFGNIPFHMRLEDKKKVKKEQHVTEDENDNLSLHDGTGKLRKCPLDEAPPHPNSERDWKRRTKTLSDVISRIKKDSSDANDVNALKSAQTDNVKTEIDGVSDDTNTNCKQEQEEQQQQQQQQQTSVDLNSSVNENGNEGNGGGNGELCGPSVRDPAGTLKRRRISDYEDEAYTRDEASLVLLTESQDNVGKRCVCMSNILRSLTFIPGNENEFARSKIFLALIGKLLLLHHEHPPRTQKTRNYDREVGCPSI